MLVYADQEYDPEEPWTGLFRSRLLVWVSHFYFSRLSIFRDLPEWTGIQTHFHLTQLGREGSQGNAVGQRPYTWYDTCYYSLLSIHSDTGAFNNFYVISVCLSRGSYASHYHLPPSSAGLTLPLTQNAFTTAF